MAHARTTLARLAVNATLAGFWAAALLVLLIFYVNAATPLTPRNFWPIAGVVALVYAPLSGATWASLAGTVRLFVAFRVPVPWVGFRPFWRFLVADLCVLAVAYAYNLQASRDYLPLEMQERLGRATLLLVVGTAALVIDAVARGLTRRRLRPVTATLAALLLSAGLFGIRERYRDARVLSSASEIEVTAPTGGVLLFAVDGGTPDDLLPMAADGRLPALGAIIRVGTFAPLSAPRPARMISAWTTIVTGRTPAGHGVIERAPFAPPGGLPLFRLLPARTGLRRLQSIGLLTPRPGDASPGVPTLDRILARCGYRVVTSGWSGVLAGTPSTVAGPVRWPAIVPHIERLREHIRVAGEHPEGVPLVAALEAALQRDITIGTAVLTALEQPAGRQVRDPAVLVRMTGLDRVAHLFTRYHRPERFGNVPTHDVNRFGEVIRDYHRFLDAWLGEMRSRLGPEPTILVVSPYGIGPVGVGQRVFQSVTGSGSASGTHQDAGPGLVLAAGPGVRPGGRLEQATAADVLPTLLYLLDLPVGRDMEGEPLRDLVSEEFANRHALAAVPSWETVAIVGPSVW